MKDKNNAFNLGLMIFHSLDGSIDKADFAKLDKMIINDPATVDIYLEFIAISAILNRQGSSVSVKEPVIPFASSDIEGQLRNWEELAEYEKIAPSVEIEKTAGPGERILTEKEREAKIQAFLAEEKALEEQERMLAELERRKIRRRELRRRKRTQQVRTVVSKMRKVLKIGAIAAVVMVVAFYLCALLTPVPPVFVATLTDGIDVKWADSQQPTEIESPLRPGLMILEKGYAQITFDEGASIILEAPCKIDLQDAHKAFVESGKLSARVPLKARGFMVNTPSASIIDLGTEFGVHVKADGSSDIHVFTGKVSLLAGNIDNLVGKLFYTVEQIVEAGQAKRVRAQSSKIQDIQFGRARFVCDMPSAYELAVRQSNPVLYWRFEQDSKYTDRIRYFGDVRIEGIGPDLGDSKPNNALKISQSNSYIMAEDVLEDNLHEAYSIVMWVRPDVIQEQNILSVKEDISDPPNDYSHLLVIEEGRFLYTAGLEQESCDYKEEFIECFSSTKLQARQWYHVAVTVHRGGLARIFVNGNTDGETFVLGGFAGEWGIIYINPPDEDDEIDGKVPSFRGAIDEIAVFRKALSPDEVRRMYSSVQK
ncbi:MAG TPA: hypothetical protein HPP87_11030 [Planctomycetes bacterium]|nr:hypothetical protein [Planctomycetota bacterium]